MKSKRSGHAKTTGMAIAILVLTTACGAQEPTAGASSPAVTPTRTSSAPASPGVDSAPPLYAKNGTNLHSCRDGHCEVVVKDGQRIPMSSAFGIGPAISVEIGDGQVTFNAKSTNNGRTTEMSIGPQYPKQAGTLNEITVDPRAVQGDTAIVRVSRG